MAKTPVIAIVDDDGSVRELPREITPAVLLLYNEPDCFSLDGKDDT